MLDAASPRLRAFVAQAPIVRRRICVEVDHWATSLPSGVEVLDVGAGERPYAELFHRARYKSHDWEQTLHSAAHDLVGDLTAGLPTPPNTFDAVLLTEVLEHVATPQSALDEVARILRPGGALLVTVPFVAPLHEEPYDFQRPTNHALERWLQDAGFSSFEVRPMSGWFGCLAQFLENCGQSLQPLDTSLMLRQRLISKVARVAARLLDRVSDRLDDAFDRRRAMPLGWVVTARR